MPLSGGRFKFLQNKKDLLAELGVGFHEMFDGAAGVEDGAVVASAEGLADFLEGFAGFFAGDIHGDHAGPGDVVGPAFAGHVVHADVEGLGDAALDEFDGDLLAVFLLDEVAEKVFDLGLGDFAVVEGGPSGDAVEGAFEAADVGFDVFGDEEEDGVAEADIHFGGFGAEDGQAGFHVGGLEFGGEAPFEAGDEALFEVFDFAGGAIAGEDDLFGAVEECVEGVEEFFLGAFFAGEELDVIDEEGIGLAEAFAEFGQFSVLDGGDELVGELFGGDVNDAGAGVFLEHAVADGVHEVGFAEADGAVDEEGVVGAGGGFGDGLGGGVGKLVVDADDEALEDVAGDEVGFGGGAGGGGFFVWGGFGGLAVGGEGFESDFGVPAGDEVEAIAELAEVVFLDPVLVDGVFDAEGEEAGFVGEDADGGEPAAEGVWRDEFAEFFAGLFPEGDGIGQGSVGRRHGEGY